MEGIMKSMKLLYSMITVAPKSAFGNFPYVFPINAFIEQVVSLR